MLFYFSLFLLFYLLLYFFYSEFTVYSINHSQYKQYTHIYIFPDKKKKKNDLNLFISFSYVPSLFLSEKLFFFLFFFFSKNYFSPLHKTLSSALYRLKKPLFPIREKKKKNTSNIFQNSSAKLSYFFFIFFYSFIYE